MHGDRATCARFLRERLRPRAAFLDGIRPHYIEAISPETAAFHEFMGDLTAIRILLRNNEFRRYIGIETGGDVGIPTMH